jgi:hypothetical protein
MLGSKLPEFAVLVSDAGQAFLWMVGKNKFEYGLHGFAYAGRSGSHLHSFTNRSRTGCNKIPAAFDFYDADPAVGLHPLVWEVAQGGNLDAVSPCRLHDCYVIGDVKSLAIYNDVNILQHMSPLSLMFCAESTQLSSYSLRKYFSEESRLLPAAWPRPQKEASCMHFV